MRAISAATSCAEIGLNSARVQRCREMVRDPMYIGRYGSMKWNILVGSMVLGASLCGQSFGGDLLHRLLGGNGCGASSSCCDTTVCDPTCGTEIVGCDPCGKDPSCGCEVKCAPVCPQPCAPAPCAPAPCAPHCGAEVPCCDPCAAPGCRRTPILDRLKGLKCKLAGFKNRLHASCDTGCADPCAPNCGCEDPCTKPCDPSCGIESPCGKHCGPSCGIEVPCGKPCAPSCGIEVPCNPCNTAPTCGCEVVSCDPCGTPSCDTGCGPRKKIGLFAKLFKSKSCCDEIACDACPSACNGCATPAAAPAAAPAVAPAPAADPHASLNTNRRVIQASSTRVR